MLKYAAVLFFVLMTASRCGSLAGPRIKFHHTYGFDMIGSRWFYIEHNNSKNWTSAASYCREIGGHLAAIKNEEELLEIRRFLRNDGGYWLGINDHDVKGNFVSLASGKPAFLKLHWTSSYYYNEQSCVEIFKFETDDMLMIMCSHERHFICQWDNEV
ncbi:accessory gland protein Acp29AB-like [Drosophila takahashii]|uniref:accessory gland protein Acp29AB-like n=1 Tax=Drosophila takahashii TaxID=29030 RepID=UPI001CF7FCF5|nr:accessory gland protein Acp29AB-like [Drosophila takahashii]